MDSESSQHLTNRGSNDEESLQNKSRNNSCSWLVRIIFMVLVIIVVVLSGAVIVLVLKPEILSWKPSMPTGQHFVQPQHYSGTTSPSKDTGELSGMLTYFSKSTSKNCIQEDVREFCDVGDWDYQHTPSGYVSGLTVSGGTVTIPEDGIYNNHIRVAFYAIDDPDSIKRVQSFVVRLVGERRGETYVIAAQSQNSECLTGPAYMDLPCYSADLTSNALLQKGDKLVIQVNSEAMDLVVAQQGFSTWNIKLERGITW